MRLAQVLLIIGQTDRAEEVIDAAFATHPEAAAIHAVQAEPLLHRKDPEGALAAARKATELDPEDPTAWHQLGRVHQARILMAQLKKERPKQVIYKEALAAFERVDREVARLLACLRSSARIGAAALLVVGDRGLAHIHTELSPNAVLAREALLALGAGAGDGVARWSAISRSNGGSAFVYAQSEDPAVRARRVLTAEAQRTRAFRVVSAEEMLRLGADPDAWFGLEAEPGFAFVDSPHAPPVRAAARRGAGGYLPHRPEMNAGFVAWGRGIRSGVRVPIMQQTDVAPTVARLLGLDLGEVEGRALVGALELVATAPDRESEGAALAP